jgi:hypothetical protein
MWQSRFTGMLVLALAACTGGAAKDAGTNGANAADAAHANAVSGGGGTAGRELASGTRVTATIQQGVTSRTNKAGETMLAIVSQNVTDANGRVVIPAGSNVTLRIDQLEPGSDQVRPEGRLSLAVASVTINNETYPLDASLEPVAHHLEGRGITKDEAARIGAGTAVGAIAGQVIGKNQKGTVLGGAIGAVAGTAVAVRYAYRDVVVSAGTPIVFTLTQSLKVAAR